MDFWHDRYKMVKGKYILHRGSVYNRGGMNIKNINQIEDVSAYAKFLDGTTQYKDKDDLSSYWGFKWQK